MSQPGGQPLISVIIPTYNHAGFVLDAVNSVLAQAFPGRLEVIVVNDGSPDHTSELLAPLQAAGKIRLIEQPNAGQAAARNRGITEAQGEFIAFLDDDDYWPNDKLAWQYAEIKNSPEMVLVYGYAEIQGADRIYRQPATAGPSGEVFHAIAKGGPVRSPGQVLIRAAALRQIGGFDAALWGVDDWDLYLRLAKVGQFKYCDRLALHYREHESNATLRFYRMFENAKKVRDKHFSGEPQRELYLACDAAIRSFTTWDGSRAFDICLKQRKRLKALGCLVRLVQIGQINLRQVVKLWLRLLGSFFK